MTEVADISHISVFPLSASNTDDALGPEMTSNASADDAGDNQTSEEAVPSAEDTIANVPINTMGGMPDPMILVGSDAVTMPSVPDASVSAVQVAPSTPIPGAAGTSTPNSNENNKIQRPHAMCPNGIT